jgi:hypothetical protein
MTWTSVLGNSSFGSVDVKDGGEHREYVHISSILYLNLRRTIEKLEKKQNLNGKKVVDKA